MQKIRNIKTSKTEKQEKDFRVSLKARKRFNLQSTDWTQLADVSITNADEMVAWRRKLRYFDIPDDVNEITERELERLIDQKPEVEVVDNPSESFESVQIHNRLNELEKQIKMTNNETVVSETKEDIVELPKNSAKDVLIKCFNEYRADQLINQGGILEYNLKKVMLEEAIDRQLANGSSNNPTTPLLDQDSPDHSEEELSRIISDCKQYFKNINELYTRLNKEERSLYNMDSNEMNEWFESHGYRYRCKN